MTKTLDIGQRKLNLAKGGEVLASHAHFHRLQGQYKAEK
jgi:hypothetical protein